MVDASASTDIPEVASRSKAARSRVTSRKAVLFGVDGRSMQARRFKDLIEQMAEDLGGHAGLSEGQRQLIRRCAMLSAECERMEADSALGLPFNVDTYGMLADRLGRALTRLGLKRVAKDVTPTLQDYLAARRDVMPND
jgi:hypothetical protein